jgi:DNA-binding transcriptional LysR family regulator
VVSFTDRYVDMVEEGIDVAIRFGALQDSTLIARRLTQTAIHLVGTPGYFATHGRPRSIDDLARHNCLGNMFWATRQARPWRFRWRGAEQTWTPDGTMSFTDGAALRDAVCAGYGIAQLRDYYVDDRIADGILEPVLETLRPPADAVWVVYPQTRHLSPKVRAFIDFMTARF